VFVSVSGVSSTVLRPLRDVRRTAVSMAVTAAAAFSAEDGAMAVLLIRLGMRMRMGSVVPMSVLGWRSCVSHQAVSVQSGVRP
jgi:hypothetical protein